MNELINAEPILLESRTPVWVTYLVLTTLAHTVLLAIIIGLLALTLRRVG